MTAKYALGLDSSTQSLTAFLIDAEMLEIHGELSLNFDQYFPQYKTESGTLKHDDPQIVHAPPQLWVEALDKLLEAKGTGVSVMLSLEVAEEELVKRLLERGKSSGRADDANEDTIKNRISVYNKETSVLVDYYSGQGKHVGIQGVGAIDEIFGKLCDAIGSVQVG